MTGPDRYCPQCAGVLEFREVHGARRPVCPECARVLYYDPKLVAATIAERDGGVLMVRRATEPGLGLWGFPGGYVDRGEPPDEAAAREVREETGLTVAIQGLVGVYSERGSPVVLLVYHGAVTGGVPRPGDEVSAAAFFPPDRLPPLAFPRDVTALERWRSMRKDGSAPGS